MKPILSKINQKLNISTIKKGELIVEMTAFNALLTKHTSINKLEASRLGKLITDEETLYEIIGQLNDNIPPKDIVASLKKGHTGWELPAFNDLQKQRTEKDNLIQNPPKPREGEIKCPRCGSLETVLRQLQTRSADEGFTDFVKCFGCGQQSRVS